MKKEKFLTVYAVFDEDTQVLLSAWQNEILKNYKGTQTMGIPFHISLGSFPVEQKQSLLNLIEIVGNDFSMFQVKIIKINTFEPSVLFVEPEYHPLLMELHTIFNGNYADGYEYHAHATIFCGTQEEVKLSKEILEQSFYSISAWIKEIHLGEFFPPKIYMKKQLIQK